mgnify:FL=1
MSCLCLKMLGEMVYSVCFQIKIKNVDNFFVTLFLWWGIFPDICANVDTPTSALPVIEKNQETARNNQTWLVLSFFRTDVGLCVFFFVSLQKIK